MLNELQPSEFHTVETLFNHPHIQHVYYSLVAGNSHGRIWADNPTSAHSAFLWDQHASYFFVGSADDALFNAELYKLITDELRPDINSVIIAYYDIDEWDHVIPTLFSNRRFVTAQRKLYHIDRLSNTDWRNAVMSGVHVERISKPLLSSLLVNTDMVISEIIQMWPSVDRFIEYSVGYCAILDNTIVSWCTGEYVYDDHIGIGIETIEGYQCKGLATAAASAFIEHCTQQNMIIHWDCWSRNLPSNMTAQKLGFKLSNVTDVLWALIE